MKKHHYLDDLKFCERRFVTKLRRSARNFRNETGRHTRPITRLEERKIMHVQYCKSGDIEDEFHVIIICPKYAEKTPACLQKYYFEMSVIWYTE